MKSPLEKTPTLIIEPVIEPKQLRNAFDVLGSRDPLHIMSIAVNYVVKDLKGLACFTAYENHYFHGIFKGRDFQCEKEAKKDIAKVKSNHLIIQFDMIFNILHPFSNLLLCIYIYRKIVFMDHFATPTQLATLKGTEPPRQSEKWKPWRAAIKIGRAHV